MIFLLLLLSLYSYPSIFHFPLSFLEVEVIENPHRRYYIHYFFFILIPHLYDNDYSWNYKNK